MAKTKASEKAKGSGASARAAAPPTNQATPQNHQSPPPALGFEVSWENFDQVKAHFKLPDAECQEVLVASCGPSPASGKSSPRAFIFLLSRACAARWVELFTSSDGGAGGASGTLGGGVELGAADAGVGAGLGTEGAADAGGVAATGEGTCGATFPGREEDGKPDLAFSTSSLGVARDPKLA